MHDFAPDQNRLLGLKYHNVFHSVILLAALIASFKSEPHPSYSSVSFINQPQLHIQWHWKNHAKPAFSSGFQLAVQRFRMFYWCFWNPCSWWEVDFVSCCSTGCLSVLFCKGWLDVLQGRVRVAVHTPPLAHCPGHASWGHIINVFSNLKSMVMN